MANKLELLQEANRRGILPPDKVAILEELQRRGVTQQPAQKEMGAVEKLGRFGTGYSPLPSKEKLAKFGEAVLELGPAFGELFVGGVQRGAELLGQEDFSRRLGEQVAKEREGLTTAQKAGRVAGKVLATAPIGFGGGALGLARGGAAVAALEPTEEGTAEAAVKQTLTGAATSLATGGALQLLGKGASKLGKGVVSKIDETLFSGQAEKPITSSMLKSRASTLFKEADKKGGELNTQFKEKFIKKAAKDLSEDSEIGQILARDSTTAKVLDELQIIKDKKFDLKGIQSVDRYLSSKILKETTPRGTLTDDGRRLLSVQEGLRKALDVVNEKDVVGGKAGFEALKKAKKLWLKSIKLSEVESILERAKYVDNPATTIKAGFRALATNPKRLKGFSTEEVKLIKDAAKTGVVTDALKTLGSRLVPIGSLVAGRGVGGVIASDVAARSSRELAKLSQAKKAEKVIEEISRSALGKAKTTPKSSRANIIAELLGRGAASTVSGF